MYKPLVNIFFTSIVLAGFNELITFLLLALGVHFSLLFCGGS